MCSPRDRTVDGRLEVDKTHPAPIAEALKARLVFEQRTNLGWLDTTRQLANTCMLSVTIQWQRKLHMAYHSHE